MHERAGSRQEFAGDHAASCRSSVHHERVRHGGHRNAAGGRDPQRRRTGIISCNNASTSARSSSSRNRGRTRRRRRTHCIKPCRSRKARSRTRHGAGLARTAPKLRANGCTAVSVSFRQTTQERRASAFPRIYIRDDCDRESFRDKTACTRGRGICAITLERAPAARARRSLHLSPIFARAHSWGWSGPRFDAGTEDAAGSAFGVLEDSTRSRCQSCPTGADCAPGRAGTHFGASGVRNRLAQGSYRSASQARTCGRIFGQYIDSGRSIWERHADDYGNGV